ncbi:MAG: hypothetical protein IBX60_07800 [Candidatus Aminicenantes bacterium]|nr:hypothetical protein [Candidatus Aminicenantes bacterium]
MNNMLDIDIEKKLQAIDRALIELSPHEEECHLCPRECGVNRRKGEKGFCKTGVQAIISHAGLHFGEEPILSGYTDFLKNKHNQAEVQRGSGTIFFAGCNLKCLYCQNYQISWQQLGQSVSSEKLASEMLKLQAHGAWNINLVSPTHMILPILKALKTAYEQGLKLPVVYNSGGYEKAEIIKHLDGIIDIYLPDFKYFSCTLSKKLSHSPDYFQYASTAIKQMYYQLPSVILNNDGVAQKGLIIRHLLIPGNSSDSTKILEWIAQNLSTSIYLSIMSQYHPCFQAPPEIQMTVSPKEYKKVVAKAQNLGFDTLFIQPEPFARDEHLIPDFTQKKPFKWN